MCESPVSSSQAMYKLHIYNLIENHHCWVKLYTLAGMHEAEVTLRCVRCKISYNYDKWGDKIDNGFRYYPVAREFVEVNDTTYFERQLQNLQCSLAYVVITVDVSGLVTVDAALR